MSKYHPIELMAWEKELIVEHAFFVILDKHTKADLKSPGDGVVRFNSFDIGQITGELSYICNRTRSTRLALQLDEISSQLEPYL